MIKIDLKGSIDDLDPTRLHDVRVLCYENGRLAALSDEVAAEEPFEIRVDGQSLAIIMRTPGHDLPLAAGFLLSEGLIQQPADVESARLALDRDGFPDRNVLDLRLRADLEEAARARTRPFTVTSSCGLCGAASIEQACARLTTIQPGNGTSPDVLVRLSAALRAAQPVFARTGGIHAAGLFDLAGELILAREDVGRHNAVDKVVGEQFLQKALPAASTILLVSGRASFELVQKAAVAGIPILAAVGAPSSLAVDAAESFGLTLVGMLRGERFVVYSHPERVRESA